MFLSGSFAAARLNGSVVGKEAYAMVATCIKAGYVLHRPGGFDLYIDHRNLCYIFCLQRVVATVLEYTADKLQRWAIFPINFDYKIKDIPAENNVCADLLCPGFHYTVDLVV